MSSKNRLMYKEGYNYSPLDKVEQGTSKCVEGAETFVEGVISHGSESVKSFLSQNILAALGLLAVGVLLFATLLVLTAAVVALLVTELGVKMWLACLIVGGGLIFLAGVVHAIFSSLRPQPKSTSVLPAKESYVVRHASEKIEDGWSDVKEGLGELVSMREIVARNAIPSISVAAGVGMVVGYLLVPSSGDVEEGSSDIAGDRDFGRSEGQDESDDFSSDPDRKVERRVQRRVVRPPWYATAIQAALPFVIDKVKQRASTELSGWLDKTSAELFGDGSQDEKKEQTGRDSINSKISKRAKSTCQEQYGARAPQYSNGSGPSTDFSR